MVVVFPNDSRLVNSGLYPVVVFPNVNVLVNRDAYAFVVLIAFVGFTDHCLFVVFHDQAEK